MTQPAEHTPGPWAVKSTDEDINTKTIIDSDEFWIAKVLNFNRASDDIRESQANANLIAAAPAMYEALQDIVEGLTDEITHMVEGSKPDTARLDYLANKAGLALAQAEGKQ
mgnify:CR=1 FL=1